MFRRATVRAGATQAMRLTGGAAKPAARVERAIASLAKPVRGAAKQHRALGVSVRTCFGGLMLWAAITSETSDNDRCARFRRLREARPRPRAGWRTAKSRCDLLSLVVGLNLLAAQLRESVYEFAKKEIAPRAAEIDKSNNFPNVRGRPTAVLHLTFVPRVSGPVAQDGRHGSAWHHCARYRFRRMMSACLMRLVTAEYGGLGLGYLEHCLVMEEISRASGSVGLSYGAHRFDARVCSSAAQHIAQPLALLAAICA